MSKKFFILTSLIIVMFLNIDFSLAETPDKSFQIKQYENQILECIKRKEYACAIDALTKIIQRDPRFIKGYLELGILNYYLGNYQEAIGFLRKAIDLSRLAETPEKDSHIGVAYICLGIVYHVTGNDKEAREELTTAIKYFEGEGDLISTFCTESLLKEINKNSKE